MPIRKYGQIKAILNLRQLVVEIDTEFADNICDGEELIVFARYDGEALIPLGLQALRYPKGKIQIVMRQDKNFFLAERFMEGGRIEERQILPGLQGLFTQAVKVGATWSAEIDDADTLKVEFEKVIRVGDEIGQL